MLLEIRARDPHRTRAFYRDLLGFADEGGALRSGDVEIRLMPADETARREHYLVVEVPDVAAALAVARADGVEVLREWSEAGSRLALIADPDGNLVELVPE